MFGGCLDYYGCHERHLIGTNTGKDEEAGQKKKQAISVKEECKHSTKTATCAEAARGVTQDLSLRKVSSHLMTLTHSITNKTANLITGRFRNQHGVLECTK